MADKKDTETKQASTMLLCRLYTKKPPCPPLSASFKHCRQWGVRRDCHLLRQQVDKCCAHGQTAHARSQYMGSIGLEKQLTTQPGNWYGSGNTFLDE
eukprot:2749274-Ditylum_brightwellii.AAC.1